MEKVSVFWFRRDLRIEDNRGLTEALKGPFPVLPIFIFDTNILDQLPEHDPRVSFIFKRLQWLRKQFHETSHGSLGLYHGEPQAIFDRLRKQYDIQGVYTNEDYEPYARQRDGQLEHSFSALGISFYQFKDQVIFAKNEVVKDNGDPYVVYTPYMKKWKERLRETNPLQIAESKSLLQHLLKAPDMPNLTLSAMGFAESSIMVPEYDISTALISNYEATRNFPAIAGTSHLGPHLRFGTLSLRQLVIQAMAVANETFLNELIWREFFMQILWHFPHTTDHAFKKQYDRIEWRNNEAEFEKWKKGETGYALVDAGMRELNQTGYMHNRVRMLVASFLCKHLLIDWRWGEAYFAEKLLDYELSSNVGNWQWAAGSGVDAAPYFRIFNPITQIEKFDKDKTYVKKWVPEFETEGYVPPIVDHKEARERCLKVYKAALS